jgi:hypothetical protein
VRVTDVIRTYMRLGNWAADDRPWFRVALHDTTADLRRAARRMRPQTAAESWSDTQACFQPAPWRYVINPDGSERKVGTRLVGTLRFAADDLDLEVVAHECAHAAAQVYRQRWREDCSLGDVCAEDEEMFAYILGDITAIVLDALHQLGIDLNTLHAAA